MYIMSYPIVKYTYKATLVREITLILKPASTIPILPVPIIGIGKIISIE